VRGELSAATARLVATAETCEDLGQPVLAACAWYDVARFGDRGRAVLPLRRLAAAAPDDGLTPMLSAHVGALADADAAALGRAANRARHRGHRLHAAEAAAQAARLHGRRRAGGDRWARTAQALIEGCEGARSPALAPLVHLDLTPREREVVGLAAEGLTSPAIARRLHLSARTVENHLHAGYAKLGVHRREELASLRLFGPGAVSGSGAPCGSGVTDGDGAGAAVDGDRDDGG
jgi:DNA-binding CsgD family transcriptional regulator